LSNFTQYPEQINSHLSVVSVPPALLNLYARSPTGYNIFTSWFRVPSPNLETRNLQLETG